MFLEFNPDDCPMDCSRPCENICPANAISYFGKAGLPKVHLHFLNFALTFFISIIIYITSISRVVSWLSDVMAVAAAYQFVLMIK